MNNTPIANALRYWRGDQTDVRKEFCHIRRRRVCYIEDIFVSHPEVIRKEVRRRIGKIHFVYGGNERTVLLNWITELLEQIASFQSKHECIGWLGTRIQ